MTQRLSKPALTVMMVDDNAFDQMLNKRVIERSGVAGQLLQFTDPVLALEHLISADIKPDVILLDINMPVMDGFEFLQRAETEVGDDLCPVVIMLTTSLDPNDRLRAKQFHIVKDFLSKPLTEDTLIKLVDDLSDAS